MITAIPGEVPWAGQTLLFTGVQPKHSADEIVRVRRVFIDSSRDGTGSLSALYM